MAKNQIAVSRTKSDTILPPPTTREVNGFVLEASVPVPTAGVGRPNRYPFEGMQIGESFTVLGEGRANLVRNSAQKFVATHTGYKFVVRQDRDAANMPLFVTEGDTRIKIFRCWRVAVDAVV